MILPTGIIKTKKVKLWQISYVRTTNEDDVIFEWYMYGSFSYFQLYQKNSYINLY